MEAETETKQKRMEMSYIFGNEPETTLCQVGHKKHHKQQLFTSAHTTCHNTSAPSLDVSRLENVRHTESKVIARCPACATQGGDRKGNHLVIFPTGKYACVANPSDAEHSSQIYALAASTNAHSPTMTQMHSNRSRQLRERSEANHKAVLISSVKKQREQIVRRHLWSPEDVWDNSPQRIDCDLVEYDPRWFLVSLFPLDSFIWTGEVYHSGKSHSHRWRTIADWQDAPIEELGPMTCPATWNPATSNRIASNVNDTPYTVLDFDGFDGQKPRSPEEVDKLKRESLAIVRWLREGLHWELAAMVWSGSKSIHAWFHIPPKDVLQSLRDTASALGIDAGLIGRPEHPCRLPGQIHIKTGEQSRVLWLQNILE